MFYCNDCAEKNGYPETMTKSEGLCELCGKHAICNDMPCSQLPKPKDMFSDLQVVFFFQIFLKRKNIQLLMYQPMEYQNGMVVHVA